GAAETVDHTAGDVATAVRAMHPGGVDAVLDLVGGRAAVNQLRPVVRDGGNIVSIAGGVDRHLPAERGIDAANVRMRVTTARLEEVAALVASGGLRLHLSGVVPLERAGDAVAQSRAGHVRGKLVITVS
ncbi:MAG: zinc-binding dehydrogenase, partial [Chloroflexi bacterium]